MILWTVFIAVPGALICVNVDEEKCPGRTRKTWKLCVDSDMKSCKLKMSTLLIKLNGEKVSRIANCCLPLLQGIRKFFFFYPQQDNIKPDTK